MNNVFEFTFMPASDPPQLPFSPLLLVPPCCPFLFPQFSPFLSVPTPFPLHPTLFWFPCFFVCFTPDAQLHFSLICLSCCLLLCFLLRQQTGNMCDHFRTEHYQCFMSRFCAVDVFNYKFTNWDRQGRNLFGQKSLRTKKLIYTNLASNILFK